MLTIYLGVTEDRALFHLLSFPEDYDPAGAVEAADGTLGNYPEPYNTVTWVGSTGADLGGITQTLAEHYGVAIEPVEAPQPVTAPAGPPGGILAALEQRDGAA